MHGGTQQSTVHCSVYVEVRDDPQKARTPYRLYRPTEMVAGVLGTSRHPRSLTSLNYAGSRLNMQPSSPNEHPRTHSLTYQCLFNIMS